MKNYIKKLFSFSRKELNGVLVLSALLFFLIISQPIINWLVPPPEVDFSDFDREILYFSDGAGSERPAATGNRPPRGETTQDLHAPALNAGKAEFDPGATTRQPPDTLFAFDPNTAGLEQLLQLGLENKIAHTLLNYREAGGRFYVKEDLKKIYGIDSADYLRLRPYIRVAGRRSVPPSGQTRDRRSKEQTAELPAASHPVISLNSADSAALLPLPGIGPVLSARIVKYRERLGGFHSAGQLLEVYGIDTAAFHQFRSRLRIDTTRIKKIDINAADYRELSRLPYWSSRQINTVLNYRSQHNGFSSLNELREIRALEKRIIQKVIPYLSLENTNQ